MKLGSQTVTATAFQRNFGKMQTLAAHGPLKIEKGQDAVGYFLSVADFRRLSEAAGLKE